MMGSPLRALGRIVAYVAWTVSLIPVQAVAVLLNRPLQRRLPWFYHRISARILGIEIVTRGQPVAPGPVLFVANHTSYLDITVLGALLQGSFVAKAEVAGWPFFGLLARLQRTVFVDRRARGAAQQRDDMARRLETGDNLILFPEGTSTDGNRVREFKSALFSVAQREVGGNPLTVQPVSVAYTRLDGMPLGRNLRPYFAWYGDMGLVGHMWEMLGLGTLTVEVEFHPPTTLAALGTRKALADHCHDLVATGVATANAGRRGDVEALPAPQSA